MTTNAYIYIRRHASYEVEKACKLGKTDNIPDRESTYITGELKRGNFDLVIEVPRNKVVIIEKMLQSYFTTLGYHVKYDAGTEFFKLDIIPLIIPYMENLAIIFRVLSKDEICELTRVKRQRVNIQKRWSEIITKWRLKRSKQNTQAMWSERPYQKAIIDQGTEELKKWSRYYLELATGGGKSYCVYKILANIRPSCIVIFTPRTNINEQNVSSKYLSLLNNEYLPILVSKEHNFADKCEHLYKKGKKVILVACINSVDKVHEWMLKSPNSSESFIWFDEAHYGVEGWMENKKRSTSQDFMLRDSEKIKWRMFTSASPEKDEIKRREIYQPITGPLYIPIKVSDLIKEKWLAPVYPYCLELNNHASITRSIRNTFNNTSSSFGFSFHHRDINAALLFKQHLQEYQRDITSIKPFLCIQRNKEIVDLLEDIECDYKCYDIDIFQKTENSIAYVVKQYDMGYDFPQLDFISITDPKLSYKDIIQCIGRGTRSDVKGPNGQNLYKKLSLFIPVHKDNLGESNFQRVAEVLRYLVIDLEMDDIINNIKLNNISSGIENDTEKYDIYDGSEENKSILMDLLYSVGILSEIKSVKKITEFCIKHGIKNDNDYRLFKELNPSVRIKNNLYEYSGFYWKYVVDPESENYYTSKQECITAKEKIISEAENLEDEAYEELMTDIEDDGWIELNKHDSKIPPYRDLDKFYPQL